MIYNLKKDLLVTKRRRSRMQLSSSTKMLMLVSSFCDKLLTTKNSSIVNSLNQNSFALRVKLSTLSSSKCSSKSRSTTRLLTFSTFNLRSCRLLMRNGNEQLNNIQSNSKSTNSNRQLSCFKVKHSNAIDCKRHYKKNQLDIRLPLINLTTNTNDLKLDKEGDEHFVIKTQSKTVAMNLN